MSEGVTEPKTTNELSDRACLLLILVVGIIMGCAGWKIGNINQQSLQQDVDWYKADRDRWQQNAQEWRNADIADRYGFDRVIDSYRQACGK